MVQRDDAETESTGGSMVAEETFDALVALGHGEADARQLIDDALIRKKFKDTESLLTAIYHEANDPVMSKLLGSRELH